jgi:putative transposase
MPKSLSNTIIHIIFSTKKQEDLISPGIEPKLHGYISTICENNKCSTIKIGGTQNHIHIACLLSKNISISKLVRTIKVESSNWLKSKDKTLKDFTWQGGYGAFYTDTTHLSTLVEYIKNQKEYHDEKSYEQEYAELSEEANI